MKKSAAVIALVLFLSAAQARGGWFDRNPDPDPRPNVFKRIGDSVTGLFKKRENVEVSATDVKTYPYPEEEWVSEGGAPAQMEIPVEKPARLPAVAAPAVPERRAEPAAVKKASIPAPETPESYTRKLKALILKKAQLPEEAKGTGLKETVKVYFALDPAGGVKRVFIPEENRSSYGYINEAAMATVKAAARDFPPLPKSFDTTQETVFNIEITYEDTL